VCVWGGGPVHGSARDGSTWSIFGFKENRLIVGPDQGKARSGPGRIGPDRFFQSTTSRLMHLDRPSISVCICFVVCLMTSLSS
jgi:hypothetical protein